MIYNNVGSCLWVYKNIEFGFSPTSLLVETFRFNKKFYLEFYWVEKLTLIFKIYDNTQIINWLIKVFIEPLHNAQI